MHLQPESTNGQLWAKPSLLPVFKSKILLELSHTHHLHVVCGCFHAGTCMPTKLKTLTICSFSEKALTPDLTSVQFSSATQSCPTLCDPMNCSTPGLPVHHQLPELTQTQVHQVSDAIQPSHLLSSPSLPAPNPSQHQGLFQCVNFSHEVAKVLKFQL